jgi:hypothetical protein
MAFGNRTAHSYNISVSTIQLPTLLPNISAHHFTWQTAPALSPAAQLEATLPFVIGGLVLLLVILVALFWRMSRKPRQAPAAPAQAASDTPAQITVPPPRLITMSLEFSAESGQHVSFTLDKPALTIGRAPDNDIVLAAPILNVASVSQHHARLRRDQEDYIVRDLNSRNGLAVNGRQTIENLLQDGDRLRLGEVEAIFHQSAGDAA